MMETETMWKMDAIGKEIRNDDQSKTLKLRVADALFWLGILCELTVSFTGYAYGNYHEMQIILLGMLCFAGKILLTMNLKQDLPIFLLCGVYGALCYYFQSSALIMRVLLILLAGRDKKAEQVIKVFFWGTLAAMLVTALLAFLGLHNEVSLTQNFRSGETTRYCFGFFNPNGFSVFAFKVYVFGLFAYGRKVRWWGYTLWMIAFGILMFLANSKMGMATMVVTTAFFFLARYNRRRDHGKLLYVIGLVIMVLELASIAAILFFLPYIREWYFWGFDPWVMLDKLTTGRLQDAYKIFISVEPNWMGRPWFPEATEVGFFNALYNQGFIFLLLYLVLLFWFYRKLYRDKNYYGMMLVLGFTLYSYGEAFLPYYNKNGVWMLMTGALPFLQGIRWRTKCADKKDEQ